MDEDIGPQEAKEAPHFGIIDVLAQQKAQPPRRRLDDREILTP